MIQRDKQAMLHSTLINLLLLFFFQFSFGTSVSFNDESEMSVWSEDECNEYRGTDSTIFPTYMDVNDGIWVSLEKNSLL